MARNYVREGMQFLKPEVDNEGFPLRRAGTEFPLYSYLLAILFRLFGFHDILGRLLSVALTASSAVFLYRWIALRFNPRLAFWSAIAMSAVPVHIYFTRTVQPESMALWALIGFGYTLDRWIRQGSLSNWLLCIAFGSLAALLKLPFLYLVCGLWLLFALEERSRGHRPMFLLVLPLTTGIVQLWYHFAKSAPVQVLPLGLSSQIENLQPVLTIAFWKTQFISRFPEVCTTYTGLVLLYIAIRRFRTRPQYQFLLGWFAVTFAYTVLLGAYGRTHRYTLIPWAPVLGVSLALGALSLWDQGTRHARILAVVLAIGIPIHAGLRIAHWYRIERTYLFRAQAELAKISGPHDLVLTNTAEIPVLLYYIDRYGYTVDLDTATPHDVEALLQKGVSYFLTPKEGSWSRHPEWQPYFDQRAILRVDDPEYRLYAIPPATARKKLS